jgi:hypothetical protein
MGLLLRAAVSLSALALLGTGHPEPVAFEVDIISEITNEKQTFALRSHERLTTQASHFCRSIISEAVPTAERSAARNACLMSILGSAAERNIRVIPALSPLRTLHAMKPSAGAESGTNKQPRIPHLCFTFVCQNGRFEAMAVLLTATLALHAGDVSHEIVIAIPSDEEEWGVVGERTLQLLHKLGARTVRVKNPLSPFGRYGPGNKIGALARAAEDGGCSSRATHIVLLDSDIVLARPLKIVGSNAAGDGSATLSDLDLSAGLAVSPAGFPGVAKEVDWPSLHHRLGIIPPAHLGSGTLRSGCTGEAMRFAYFSSGLLIVPRSSKLPKAWALAAQAMANELNAFSWTWGARRPADPQALSDSPQPEMPTAARSPGGTLEERSMKLNFFLDQIALPVAAAHISLQVPRSDANEAEAGQSTLEGGIRVLSYRVHCVLECAADGPGLGKRMSHLFEGGLFVHYQRAHNLEKIQAFHDLLNRANALLSTHHGEWWKRPSVALRGGQLVLEGLGAVPSPSWPKGEAVPRCTYGWNFDEGRACTPSEEAASEAVNAPTASHSNVQARVPTHTSKAEMSCLSLAGRDRAICSERARANEGNVIVRVPVTVLKEGGVTDKIFAVLRDSEDPSQAAQAFCDKHGPPSSAAAKVCVDALTRKLERAAQWVDCDILETCGYLMSGMTDRSNQGKVPSLTQIKRIDGALSAYSFESVLQFF